MIGQNLLQIFKSSSIKIPLLQVNLVAMIIFWGLNSMLFMKNEKQKHYTTDSKSPFDALYFTIVSQSSTGYGDITPKSTPAKLIVMCHLLITMTIVGLLII
jgi:hypothetical protein